ncbi:ABC transporter permease subunit [Leifsonia sp. PS1209]|uniref:ABC transporter permease n=1 Tax=Leifsonia sp. PS1209 TaxID=2724914 RepID=UPI001442A491|nr:ABC transporter permease subunit [Leifsonia sp. PS1209]QIZ98684.1 ABC transporter permease subunit [Leifsonia sp. PS1209]
MSWLWSNIGLVWDLTVAHVTLSVFPIIIGFIVSLPIGWVANRYRGARGLVLTLGGILYAIPSLPLFVAMPALIGTKILDPKNVVVALSLYALALMVRTTADALASVPGDVMQSATAIGFSTWRRFWAVELPLSGPVLLAGLRVVSVSTVSLVSVGSLVGVSNLGTMFIQGLNQYNNAEVVTGIVGIIVIALVFDLALVLLGRLLMPWTRLGTTKRAARRAALKAVTGA